MMLCLWFQVSPPLWLQISCLGLSSCSMMTGFAEQVCMSKGLSLVEGGGRGKAYIQLHQTCNIQGDRLWIFYGIHVQITLSKVGILRKCSFPVKWKKQCLLRFALLLVPLRQIMLLMCSEISLLAFSSCIEVQQSKSKTGNRPPRTRLVNFICLPLRYADFEEQ